MVQEARIIHYTWEETELEMDRAERLSIIHYTKPFSLSAVLYSQFCTSFICDTWAQHGGSEVATDK